MRVPVFLVVLMFLGAWLIAAPSAAEAAEPETQVAPAGPDTVDSLEKALRAELARLEALLKLAAKDHRFRRIETYRRYKIEDFSDPKRDVKAFDLLEIMSDPGAPLDLRKEAFSCLTGSQAKAFDPDLQRTKGASGKPRNEFFRRHVAKLLWDKDQDTRVLARDLFVEFYPGYDRENEVMLYDPVNGTKRQWKKTAAFWRDELSK